MQNEPHSSLCQIKMPTQNYMRAAVAPRSRASWKADCRHGGTVQWGLKNQQGEEENTLNTGSAMWLLNHNYRYLHLLTWKKLMLSDGELMFSVQEAHAADIPASIKTMFWKLEGCQIEVIHVCNPPLVWRHICHWCSCAGAVLSGERGSWHTGWFVQPSLGLWNQDFAPEKAEPQVQLSYQSMKNQYTVLTCCCGCCSTDHKEEQIESKVYEKIWCHIIGRSLQ